VKASRLLSFGLAIADGDITVGCSTVRPHGLSSCRPQRQSHFADGQASPVFVGLPNGSIGRDFANTVKIKCRHACKDLAAN